ncbi:MAG: thioredoxin domain-containing protein, partial [Bryobacterales bacterium]|nr:thioredoxin domain-containing protein [Bryobacterales bacterium]
AYWSAAHLLPLLLPTCRCSDSIADPDHPENAEEGAYYLWTAEEVRGVLGEPVAGWFCSHYGVGAEGEWVLSETQTLEETAAQAGMDASIVANALAEARRKLLEHRNRRPRPARDEKILTCWNGLMLSALARAARVLGDDRYLDAASACVRFLGSRLAGGEGLLRRYWRGEAGIPAFLEDYAYLVQGLLDLYEASLDPVYLDWGVKLWARQAELFEDSEGGGYFSTRRDAALPVRFKDDYDGAEPSANSISALNALRLAAITGREEYREQARRTLAAFGRQLAVAPDSLPLMVVAALYERSGMRQVVFRGDVRGEAVRRLRRVVDRGFYPDVVVLAVEPQEEPAWRAALAGGSSEAAAHVCENFACQAPVDDPEELARQLRTGRTPLAG